VYIIPWHPPSVPLDDTSSLSLPASRVDRRSLAGRFPSAFPAVLSNTAGPSLLGGLRAHLATAAVWHPVRMRKSSRARFHRPSRRAPHSRPPDGPSPLSIPMLRPCRHSLSIRPGLARTNGLSGTSSPRPDHSPLHHHHHLSSVCNFGVESSLRRRSRSGGHLRTATRSWDHHHHHHHHHLSIRPFACRSASACLH